MSSQTEGRPRTLAAALAAFQAAMPVVPKTKTAQVRGKDGTAGYSYTYAGLAEVSAAAAPLLAEQGLSFSCVPTVDEHGRITLAGVLLHSNGEEVRGTLPIAGTTPQQVGSALTYARRYLMGCMTGIVTDDDDDGALASRAGKKAPGQTVRRKPRATAGAPVTDTQLPDPWESPQQPPGVTAEPDPPQASGATPHAPQVAPTPAPTEENARLGDGLRKALMLATSRLGIDPTNDRVMRLALWSALLARRIDTTAELSRTEALTLLRRMNDCETGAVEWAYSVETGAVTLRHVDQEIPHA